MITTTRSGLPTIGLRREIDRLFDDVFAVASTPPRVWNPPVDIHETDTAFVVEVETPGVDPAAIEVTADQGVLRIHGSRAATREDGAGRQHLTERSFGSFTRAFQLPPTVEESGISASSQHGVLTVRLPKAPEPEPRKIAVETR